ncbi:amidohydrolase family protein [Streptomyces sp. NPDC058464]|uniref:amidohydrolase family protein n=1 Tax=Streptomyces sp. NPDC058464 TaxID=3346511 RepID=UPI00364A4E94
MTSTHHPARIDVHQHVNPPVWLDTMERNGLTDGWPIRAWDPDSAIAMMDDQGIATGILSVTTPGIHFGDDAEARTLARAVNEYGAEVVKNRPDRFGYFAMLPWPDLDGALTETAHAMDALGADGVVLLSNVHGRYLGEPEDEPLWDELDRRHATVFIHPSHPPVTLLPGVSPALADFLFDTTRAALNLALKGTLARHPNVKVILSHAGGYLPYIAYRVTSLTSTVLAPDRTPEDVLTELKRFYFDTALSASPSALPALLSFAEPGRVLYGSDWPYAPEAAGAYHNRFLDTHPDLTPEGRAAINRTNAEALFPRLASDDRG